MKEASSNIHESASSEVSMELMNCARAVEILSSQTDDDDDEELNFEATLEEIIIKQWESEEEFAKFFIVSSLSMYNGLANNEATLFDQEITYSFYPGTRIWNLWTKARKKLSLVEHISIETGCVTEEMREQFNITSIFNIIPAALKESYGNQSLGEWLANGYEEFSHEDNEFLCTFIALVDDDESLLLDIVSNLRNSIVLDELVFCRPELIMTEELLIGGYGGLLENRSLSSDALYYLSALFLELPLPAEFSAKTQGDLVSHSPKDGDVIYFRENYKEYISALDRDLIGSAILRHPNCAEDLRQQLE